MGNRKCAIFVLKYTLISWHPFHCSGSNASKRKGCKYLSSDTIVDVGHASRLTLLLFLLDRAQTIQNISLLKRKASATQKGSSFSNIHCKVAYYARRKSILEQLTTLNYWKHREYVHHHRRDMAIVKHQLVEGGLHRCLTLGIERACGLIQKEKLGILQDSSTVRNK